VEDTVNVVDAIPDANETGEDAKRNLWKAVGPGILIACAAIGASHLVWSTRAGAIYGWDLVGLVLLANFLKFPFYLYGQRYAAATGESLLDGYRRQGVGYVYMFLIMNMATGTISIAAISMLAGALAVGSSLVPLSVPQAALAILAICTVIILFGRYKVLDGLAKVIITVLGVCTIIAVALAFGKPVVPAAGFVAPDPWTFATLPFLIMLLGWMPAPMDLSAWSSLWMFSRKRQTGHMATPKEASFDFYLGYIACALLAVLFVALGALVMHGSGVPIASGGVGFSRQLVELYTATIGEWSYPLILAAAFITIFSTLLTILDGYPRSLAACCSIIAGLDEDRFRSIHRIWMVLSSIAAALVIMFFVKNLLQMLSVASVVSFMTAPILAWVNFRVMRGENVPQNMRPGIVLKVISYAGLIFFGLLGAGYVYVTFLM